MPHYDHIANLPWSIFLTASKGMSCNTILTADGGWPQGELWRMIEAAVPVQFLPQEGGVNVLLPHLDQVDGSLQ